MVPQGGNTGLVGGSVPVHDEVILTQSIVMSNVGGVLCIAIAKAIFFICGGQCAYVSLKEELYIVR